MATRERKAKMNAESPTPNSTSSDSASTPTTPTSLIKKTIGKPPTTTTVTSTIKRSIRGGRGTPIQKDKQDNDDEEEVENETSEETTRATTPATTINNTENENVTITRPKSGRLARIPIRRQIGTRTTSLEALKKGNLKRRSFPENRRYGSIVTRRNSTGRVEFIKKLSKDDLTNEKLVKPTETKKRVGRPKKGAMNSPEIVPIKRKRLLTDVKEDVDKKPEKFIKLEDSEAVSDSELSKLRRNSDSASKCSDMTDNSYYDSPLLFKDQDKEIENNNQDQEDLFKENIKEELIDEELSLSGKSKEKTNSEPDNLDKKPLRRSGRPRKSTLKDRDIPTTPKSKQIDIKTEPTTPSTCIDETSKDSTAVSSEDGEIAIPLHVDTELKSVTPIIAETDEKASSLSPELESEGVSVISVKQFYGEPAFLENNLGIEKDPKLGEILLDKGADADVHDEVIKEEEKDTKIQVIPDEVKKVEELVNTKTEIVEEVTKEVTEDSTKEDDDEEALVIDETVQDDDEEKCEETNKIVDKKDEIIEKQNVEDPPKKSIEIIEIEENDEKQVEVAKVEVIEIKDDSLEIVENVKVEDEVIEVKADDKKVQQKNSEPEDDQNKNSSAETVQIDKIEKVIEDEIKPENVIKVDEVIENKDEQDMESDNKENVESSCKSIEIENNITTIIDDSEIKENLEECNETPEAIKQKESHLKSLGLLTLKAADEAKIEKQRQKELLQTTTTTTVATQQNKNIAKVQQQQQQQLNQKSSNNEYTGTLKTVIKLHRPPNPDKRKRLPLKMTFQKGRGKQDKDSSLSSNTVEDTYYTIQNEMDSVNLEVTSHGGQSRKTLNRSHTDGGNHVIDILEPPAKDVEKSLVIPEKASSFSIHPGRLCRDQCFYCGGKFGLFDTPCHVAQIKSLERQKKILDNEEKLTVDSCLCDACYRHVDRRANCPSYKKRLAPQMGLSSEHHHHLPDDINKVNCQVTGCHIPASHSLRRKWFLKMKKSINKLIQINFDPSNSIQIPICDTHFDVISHLMVCTLCKRKLSKNHIFYITQELPKLEELLSNQGIPVLFGSTPVVCKLCRYYANLLLKPPESKTQKAQFVKNYRRRLLQFHNVEIMDDSDTEIVQNDQHQHVNKKQKIQTKNGNELLKIQSRKSSDGNAMDEPYEGGHILLDNDVMVDYDVPMIDSSYTTAHKLASKNLIHHRQQQQSLLIPKHQLHTKQQQRFQQPPSQENKNKDYTADMARALRANPNISMRELFPGEEDLALHANIPFNSSAGQKTPEGWTRVTTTLQYDDVTKHMWEELQKPYGNQSSFLRHLVLLEKYFRNGDLILSQNASYNAVNYSESIQNRLKSYDNISTGGLTIMQQLSNAPITITPAITIKQKTKVCDVVVPTTSLLKSNNPSTTTVCLKKAASLASTSSQNEHKQNRLSCNSSGSSNNNNNKTETQILIDTKQILAAATKLLKSDETSISPATNKKIICSNSGSGSLPPELISINTKTSSSTNNHHQQQSSIAITPIQSSQSRKSPGPSSNASSSTSSSSSGNNNINKQQQPIPANVIKLPDTLSSNERKQTNGKPWRPTLIPIAPNSNQSNQGQLYQTADGRRLPSLVQVMSSGKPYHISIHDYNRMCILRREKLMQLQSIHQKTQQQQQQVSTKPSMSSSASSSSSSTDNDNKNVMSTNIAGTNKKVQIPNKILEQNSVIPVVLNKSSGCLSVGGSNNSGGEISGIKGRKSAPTSLLKNHVIAIAPKPPQLPISTSVVAMSVSSQHPSASSSINSTTLTPTSSSSTTSTVTSQNQTTTNIWMWNDENINGNNNNGNSSSSTNTIILDNQAASVLSKIPKSLTVIPQQKGQSRSSIEEQQHNNNNNNNSA